MNNVLIFTLIGLIVTSCNNDKELEIENLEVKLSNQIERVEPPNWWTHFNDRKLELMVYKEKIGNSNILWRGQTTSVGSKDQLKIAKQTGCLELSVGIETVDNDVMKIINKTWQSDKIIANFINNA